MAVLAIGTSDGFTVAPEGPFWRQSILRFWAKKRKRRLSVRIRGGEAPVLGRVSMNLTSVDVTDLPGVEIGDVAEVPCLRLAASASLPRVFLDA
jgi:alanine racemase